MKLFDLKKYNPSRFEFSGSLTPKNQWALAQNTMSQRWNAVDPLGEFFERI